MKKKLLIPLLFIPFLLGGCKDKHTIKQNDADLIVLDKEYKVGNTLGQRDLLMKFGTDDTNKDKIISGQLEGYVLIHKDSDDGYYKNFDKPGAYYLELSKDGYTYNYKVTVVDIVEPVVNFKDGSTIIKATIDNPLTVEYIIKNYVTVTDDTSASKNIKITINDGDSDVSYFNNQANWKVGDTYRLTLHATDEAGNTAQKPFTIQIIA